MKNFKGRMNRWALRDIGYVGQWWMWERGKTIDTRVREWLDMYIASPSWSNLYLYASMEHFLRYNSDHSPILVKVQQGPNRAKQKDIAFKFETAWLFDKTCEQVVREAWGECAGDSIVNKCEELEGNDLNRKHEAYWWLRSRVLGVKDGDRNTSYFYHKVSQRKHCNRIEGIYDDEGVWQEEAECGLCLRSIIIIFFTFMNPSHISFAVSGCARPCNLFDHFGFQWKSPKVVHQGGDSCCFTSDTRARP